MTRENYTVGQFLKDRDRMCVFYQNCKDCPAYAVECLMSHLTADKIENNIDVVYKWAQGHPESEGQE